MNVLVTGGAGFIGANTCRRLVEDGFEVTVIDDFSTGRRENLRDLKVQVFEASINDGEALRDACGPADAVIHLAARPSVPRSLEDPVASHVANASGTVSVLEAARSSKVQLVVVASSSSVYGGNPTLPKTEDLAARPLSPYAASKLATEAYALAYQASFGVPVLAFRFFNVFGPLQPAGHAYAAVVPAFVHAALSGEPLPLQGDGQQSRDFTFVGTVASVLRDAVTQRVSSTEPVNLAFGTRTNLLELISLLEEIVGDRLAVRHDAARKGDVRHSQADNSLLRELFPHARPVGLREGLQETVHWFRAPETYFSTA